MWMLYLLIKAKFIKSVLHCYGFLYGQFSIMDVRFKHPFNCIVSAPTKSGKTELVKI